MTVSTIAPNGKRLKELRTKMGLSAARLALKAGLSERQIWRLEAGTRPQVSAVTLARIALVLNTTLEYLLGMTDNPEAIQAGESPSPTPDRYVEVSQCGTAQPKP